MGQFVAGFFGISCALVARSLRSNTLLAKALMVFVAIVVVVFVALKWLFVAGCIAKGLQRATNSFFGVFSGDLTIDIRPS